MPSLEELLELALEELAELLEAVEELLCPAEELSVTDEFSLLEEAEEDDVGLVQPESTIMLATEIKNSFVFFIGWPFLL